MVEHLIADDRGVFIAALRGVIEAKVDTVEFAVERGDERADRGRRGTFRRGEPNEVTVRVLLHY